jgi:hypothetical protein
LTNECICTLGGKRNDRPVHQVPRGGKIRRGEAWEEKRGRKEAGWKEARSSTEEERRGEDSQVGPCDLGGFN